MKKSTTPSTTLVPLNQPMEGSANLPAVIASLPAKSPPRQPLILDAQRSAELREFDPGMRQRSGAPCRTQSEIGSKRSSYSYDLLRHTTEQVLDDLIAPKLKRFMRHPARST